MVNIFSGDCKNIIIETYPTLDGVATMEGLRPDPRHHKHQTFRITAGLLKHLSPMIGETGRGGPEEEERGELEERGKEEMERIGGSEETRRGGSERGKEETGGEDRKRWERRRQGTLDRTRGRGRLKK